jgi:hypothetical protein
LGRRRRGVLRLCSCTTPSRHRTLFGEQSLNLSLILDQISMNNIKSVGVKAMSCNFLSIIKYHVLNKIGHCAIIMKCKVLV